MLPLLLAPLLAKLAESGLSLIGNAVLNKGKQVVEEKLGVSLDTALETDEGKQALMQLQNDHEETLLQLALDNRKLDLDFYKVDASNTQNARDSNVAIQQTSNASWLAKNTAYIIAYIVIIGGGIILYRSADADVRMASVSAITLVLGFFFGTSQSSKQKDTTIENMSGATK